MDKKRGFTMIEILIATAIFLIFAVGAYRAFSSLYGAISSSRHKALAADLANAQFEIIKNLPYTSVGTVGGTPPGVVAASQDVVRDNIAFTITTTIINVDDPFDGLSGSGDAFPADYKLVEVRIVCSTCKAFAPVVITGRVAPKNLES